MDWAEYKRLCDQRHVISRHLLVSTAEIIEASGERALASRLRSVCESEPIARPPDHRGDARSHMFHASFSRAEAERILEILGMSEVSGISAMCAAWREYQTDSQSNHTRLRANHENKSSTLCA